MTEKTAISVLPEGPVTAESVKNIATFWRGLPRQSGTNALIFNEERAAEARITLDRIGVKAGDQWIAGRIATMMMHYPVPSVSPDAFKVISNDWIRELSGLPAWAIFSAVKWWMGAENPRRSFRPMPGDIRERANHEMNIVNLLTNALRMWESRLVFYGADPLKSNEVISEESKARVREMVSSFARKHGVRVTGHAADAGADDAP